MPSALLRPCATSGCVELVTGARCAAHAREHGAYRGSASSRGYTSRWARFRARFSQRLIGAGIAPVCGAALPGGPAMTASRCKAADRLNNKHLHLHHDPPLRAEERQDWRLVCDPFRVMFLCATCHNRATQGQQQHGVPGE